MIEIKMLTIVNSMEVLKRLSESKIRGRTAYKIAKILKRVDEEYGLFQDARRKLILECAKKDENGEPVADENGNVSISEENISMFNEEISKLLETTVNIDTDKIHLDEIEQIDFTPSDIIMIEDFIEE